MLEVNSRNRITNVTVKYVILWKGNTTSPLFVELLVRNTNPKLLPALRTMNALFKEKSQYVTHH